MKNCKRKTQKIQKIDGAFHNQFVDIVERYMDLCDTKRFSSEQSSKIDIILMQEWHGLQDINHMIDEFNQSKSSLSVYYASIMRVDELLNGYLELRKIYHNWPRGQKDLVVNAFDPNKTREFDNDIAKINAFRMLRSVSIAHPFDTWNTEDGVTRRYYCEDVIPGNSIGSLMLNRPNCDYIVKYRVDDDTTTREKYISFQRDILNIVRIVAKHVKIIGKEMQEEIQKREQSLRQQHLRATKALLAQDFDAWLDTLEQDVQERYPALVKEGALFDDARTAIHCRFSCQTEKQYEQYRQYVINNLMDFADRLQDMQIDGGANFTNVDETILSNIDEEAQYSCEKIHRALANSTRFSYKSVEKKRAAGNYTNTEWAIMELKSLMPYLSKVFCFDVAVNDQQLYYQFCAAVYNLNLYGCPTDETNKV